MAKDFKDGIRSYINEEIKVLKQLDIEAVDKVLEALEETRLNGSRVYVFGNGGSAATASHMQNDFNKGISEHLKVRYNFVCLNDNVATLMAIANDDCYENIFMNQLEHRLEKGDVVVAISGSGNSENVIRAVEYAKKQGNKVIGLTGYSGGRLKMLADIDLHVPIDNMQITEDVHIAFNHMMMYVLSSSLKGER